MEGLRPTKKAELASESIFVDGFGYLVVNGHTERLEFVLQKEQRIMVRRNGWRYQWIKEEQEFVCETSGARYSVRFMQEKHFPLCWVYCHSGKEAREQLRFV